MQSSWDLSAGERSKGVRPILLQILLHRWEWKKSAMPRTPGTQDGAPWTISGQTSHSQLFDNIKWEVYLNFHLQSRSPSLCGSEGRCRDPRLLGCLPRSAGGPSARRRSDWRPDGCKQVSVIKPLLAEHALTPKDDVTHLWSESDVVVPHETWVGVVFDVLALDVMFQVEERFAWPVGQLHHIHLHNVHLRTRNTFWLHSPRLLLHISGL